MGGRAAPHGAHQAASATACRFHHIAVDDQRLPTLVYAADTSAHVVRVKQLAQGTWRIFAGQTNNPGFFNGPGQLAQFHNPTALCIMPHGSLAVADAENACIRAVSPAGV